jgi:beta-lactamase class A
MDPTPPTPGRKRGVSPVLIGGAIGIAVGWILLAVVMIVLIGRVNAEKRPGPVPRLTRAAPSVNPDLYIEKPAPPSSGEGFGEDQVPPRPEVPPAPLTETDEGIDREALGASLDQVQQTSGGRMSVSYIGPDQKRGFAYQGDRPAPAGELMKLCLLVSALKRVDQGEWDPDAPLPGTGMALRDALPAMMSGSDPVVANAIIDEVGIEALNGEIHGYMALSQSTQLQRRLLDMSARAQGLENTTTTNDMAQLLFSLTRGELLGGVSTEMALETLASPQPQGKIPRGIPSLAGVAVGNRPAELPDLEADAAVIWYPDHRWSVLVVSVSGHDEPMAARRAVTDATAIIWAATN